MMTDILLQAVLILISIIMYLAMHNIPQRILAKFREYRGRSKAEAKRQFVLGAQTLAQARSPSITLQTKLTLAKKAEEAATKAISLDPADAAAHILKAIALDLQGFKSSAIDSIDVALSPIAIKSLSESERGDAYLKRAELVMGSNKEKKIEMAIRDLKMAVELNNENGNAFRLLGECYENSEMNEEAINAYEMALKLKPDLVSAKEALQRLSS